MLVALNSSGDRVEASRYLPRDDYRCAVCEEPAVFKPGRIRIPHFAHGVNRDCLASDHEGPAHLAAKRTLADWFRYVGYDVTLEETYVRWGRRIDLVVRDASGNQIAVEVQDSPISAEVIKDRNKLDKRIAMDATIWVFTSSRAPWAVDGTAEARIPDEMLYLDHLHGNGVFVLADDVIVHCTFSRVHREGSTSEWYETGGVLMSEHYPGRTLKSTRSLTKTLATFEIVPFDTKYGVTATFKPADLGRLRS